MTVAQGSSVHGILGARLWEGCYFLSVKLTVLMSCVITLRKLYWKTELFTYYNYLGGRERRIGKKIFFEEIMAKIFPKLIKTETYRSTKLSEL